MHGPINGLINIRFLRILKDLNIRDTDHLFCAKGVQLEYAGVSLWFCLVLFMTCWTIGLWNQSRRESDAKKRLHICVGYYVP